MSRKQLSDELAPALAAGRERVIGMMLDHFVRGGIRIARRWPPEQNRRFASIHSWDYAKHSGYSGPRSLRALRSLVNRGALAESVRHGQVVGFLFPVEQVEAWIDEAIAIHEAAGYSRHLIHYPTTPEASP